MQQSRFHKVFFAAAALICVALLCTGVFGCGGSKSGSSGSGSKAAAAETANAADNAPAYEDIYDLCFGDVSDAGENYYLFDLDSNYIKFFSTIPQVDWFETYYTGDLDGGIEAYVNSNTVVWIRYADPSESTIVADYSYGESYYFTRFDTSEALRLLNDDETPDQASVVPSGENVRPSQDSASSLSGDTEAHIYILDTEAKKIHNSSCSRAPKADAPGRQTVAGTAEEIRMWYSSYSVCDECHARY